MGSAISRLGRKATSPASWPGVRGVVLVAGLAITTVGFLIAAAPASAAKPHGGARYLGFEGPEIPIYVNTGLGLFTQGRHRSKPKLRLALVAQRPVSPADQKHQMRAKVTPSRR